MRCPDGHPYMAATLDWVMAPFAAVRPKVIRPLSGRVLEVGVGTGLNAEHFDTSQITELVGIEPDPHMLARARPRYGALPFPTELHQVGAEELPFPDNHFNAIACTFVLCTIPEVEAAVRELYRVLVPGGAVWFVEHTVADQAPTRAAQTLLSPAWFFCGAGCNLMRDPVSLLREGGFSVEDVRGHGRTLLNVTPLHRGRAVKPESRSE